MNRETKLPDTTGEILKKSLFNAETFKHTSIAELEAMRENYKKQIEAESADKSINDPENHSMIMGLLADLEVIEQAIKDKMQ